MTDDNKYGRTLAREAAKKRGQRDRKRRGAQVVAIEIPDFREWSLIMAELGYLELPATPAQVAAGTSEWMNLLCLNHQVERTLEPPSPRVGLAAREGQVVATYGATEARLIKGKQAAAVRRQRRPDDIWVQEEVDAPGDSFGVAPLYDDVAAGTEIVESTEVGLEDKS
jgi:hypothetical protein